MSGEMLTYSMERRGNTPLYEYLCARIREDILSGRLPARSRLPSKRALAEHLHLSVVTVEGAYAQLEAEGYLTARPRRGFFVAEVERPAPAPAAEPQPEEAQAAQWRLDLSRSQVDEGSFPVSAWARLTRRVLSEERAGLMAPVPSQGLSALRTAIAEDLRAFRGMSVAPGQIVVGAGAEYLYVLLAQLLGRSTVFALEDPGYSKIRQVYEACGVVCRPIPVDGGGMDAQALAASGAQAAHISPSHHYPTGAVTGIGRRQALLRWAEAVGGWIIEDDYDGELRFTGRPIPTLQSIDRSGRVVYMNTFSQTISPSMRLGFMVLPPRLLERYRERLNFYACTVPALDQYVLSRFIAEGYYERHLARLRKAYRARRDAVLAAFRASAFAPRVAISEQGAGLHFLLRLRTDEPDEALRRRGEALGVRLAFLSDFAVRPEAALAHTLVVNYAGLTAERLTEAVALLEELL